MITLDNTLWATILQLNWAWYATIFGFEVTILNKFWNGSPVQVEDNGEPKNVLINQK